MAIKIKDRSMPFSGGTLTEGSPRLMSEVSTPNMGSDVQAYQSGMQVGAGVDEDDVDSGQVPNVDSTSESTGVATKAVVARPNDKAPIPSGPAVANLSKHREIVTGAAVANPAYGYRNPSPKDAK